jgi:hypothetical protein
LLDTSPNPEPESPAQSDLCLETTDPISTPILESNKNKLDVHSNSANDLGIESVLKDWEEGFAANSDGEESIKCFESDKEDEGATSENEATSGNEPPGGQSQALGEDEENQEIGLPQLEEIIADVPFFKVPQCVENLRKALRGDYKAPPKPHDRFTLEELSPCEILSLKHYIAWRKTNGTVLAYNEHRRVLESATDIEILSLHSVRKLALQTARLVPQRIDMCPKSCMAYTGDHKDKTHCSYVHPKSKSKIPCGEPRFKKGSSPGALIPRAQYTALPLIPSIQAMFANAETSRLLRYRDKTLQETIKMLASAANHYSAPRFSDFSNGTIHALQYQSRMGLFQDERDIALALSSDGAQLTMKKQSNTWLLILIILNLPPEIRYRARNVIINFATPGPNSPGDIESFIRPLFEELAQGSEGIWLWDAVDSSWFFHRMYAVMFNGDMLGSAKVNGMAGHSAKHGDRFWMIPGARTSLDKGAKAQYYPLCPPQNDRYNQDRPAEFSTVESIVLRKQEDYWKVLNALDNSKLSGRARALLVKNSGVSRMPLAAASAAFVHPSFFPLDPFHLFYENCIPFFWDIWTGSGSGAAESIHISDRKAQKFGELVPAAMKTIPPSFCGPVRDPFLKRNSQYKAYEWMALLHWYVLAIGIELEFNAMLLDNFSRFVEIVEYAMTIKPRSQEELDQMHGEILEFLQGYELLYVGNDPTKIHRCRLCVFQLIHIPNHIRWFGSVRLGSQATVERAIGEMGHKIRSKKEPFANLTNIIVEQEVIRLVEDYYPELSEAKNKRGTAGSRLQAQVNMPSLSGYKHSQKLKISQATDFSSNLGLISRVSMLHMDLSDVHIFGKIRLSNGQTLRSRDSEKLSALARSYRWFEVCPSQPIIPS